LKNRKIIQPPALLVDDQVRQGFYFEYEQDRTKEYTAGKKTGQGK
jgi:hypothetical protein